MTAPRAGNGDGAVADTWQAVYRVADGELVSTGTIVPERLDAGLASLPLDHEPDWFVERWNPGRRLLEPRPADPAAVDRITTFEADPDVQALAAIDRAMLHDKLLAYFGDIRRA